VLRWRIGWPSRPWRGLLHLQSDSLGGRARLSWHWPGAFADLSILTATRDTLFSAFTGLPSAASLGLRSALRSDFGHANRLMEVTVEAIGPFLDRLVADRADRARLRLPMEIVIVAFACVWRF